MKKILLSFIFLLLSSSTASASEFTVLNPQYNFFTKYLSFDISPGFSPDYAIAGQIGIQRISNSTYSYANDQNYPDGTLSHYNCNNWTHCEAYLLLGDTIAYDPNDQYIAYINNQPDPVNGQTFTFYSSQPFSLPHPPIITPTPGDIYEYSLSTNDAALTSISLGPDDKLWFAEQGSNKVGNITTDGFITEYPTSGAGDINVGPDGNLWFTQVFNNAVGKISPQGEITEYSIPNSNEPRDITAGPDGNLWFTQQSGNKITKMDTNGNILADYSLPNPDSRPRGITSGPDGNIWFAEENYPVIGRITPDGIITEFPTSNGTLDITTGPDGNLWFTVFQSNSIGKTTTDGVVTEYAIPTDNSGPYAITTGPDHNLWFTQTQSNKIAKIDINGIFTEYNVPTLNSRPFGITSGPDGNIWFTEFNTDKIGRLFITAITPTPTITPTPLPFPSNKDQCKKDGWKNYAHLGFKNQGLCISYVNHH